MITHRRLLEVLDYNPKTGRFSWIGYKPGSKPGKCGCHIHHGYWGIRLDGRVYYAHRLAWFYVYGRWPKHIDHKNCDGSDNRIGNLREATASLNHGNMGKNKKNTTGYKGVVRWRNRFKAQLNHRKRCYYLGLFDTAKEAHMAYQKKAREIFGEFARGA